MSENIIKLKVFDNSGKCYSSLLKGNNYMAGTIYNYEFTAKEDLSHSFLPVFEISTPKNKLIKSKSKYVNGTQLSVLQSDNIDLDAK